MKIYIYKKEYYKNKLKKGFTLIETLVSLALFSIVLVITGGVIVSVLDINKKNQLVSNVVSNLNYSIDSMIRDIKTGYLYKCDYIGLTTVAGLKADISTITTGGSICANITLISTTTGQDVVVKYELIQPPDSNWYIQKTIYPTSGGIVSSYSITDKTNVNIKDLYLYITNHKSLDEVSGPYGQPSVFVSIKGSAGDETLEASKFFVQTFISQRLINITDFKD
jgi:prepilin-type N-terminal cleavage/methylation domain-containing protein